MGTELTTGDAGWLFPTRTQRGWLLGQVSGFQLGLIK